MGRESTRSRRWPRPRTPVDQNDAVAMATALRQRMDDSRMHRARVRHRSFRRMVPGSTVEIDGLGAIFNGEYYCRRGRTHLSTGRTSSSLDSPSELPSRHRSSICWATVLAPSIDHFLGGVTVGVVTNIEDPEARMTGEAQVAVPLRRSRTPGGHGCCSSAPATNGVGRMLPEVDDEVIVAFEHGDIDCRSCRWVWLSRQGTADPRRARRQQTDHTLRTPSRPRGTP